MMLETNPYALTRKLSRCLKRRGRLAWVLPFRSKAFVRFGGAVGIMAMLLLGGCMAPGCGTDSDKSLAATMRLIAFMLPQHLNERGGIFPYDRRGPEYALYAMALDRASGGQNELYQEQPDKTFAAPFGYDHDAGKVTDSQLLYWNAEGVSFEPDPEKDSVLIITRDREDGGYSLTTTGLCVYRLVPPAAVPLTNPAALLGKQVTALEKEFRLELVADQKYFMTDFVAMTEDNCGEMYGSWFCMARTTWMETWRNTYQWQENFRRNVE